MTDPSDAAEASVDEHDPLEPTSREPRHRRRLLIVSLAGALVLVMALGTAGLVGSGVVGEWRPATIAAVEVAQAEPTEPPSPFAGTPAEDFAEGADGIVLPEAEPVGEFTADEVAEALEQVREALIAARLDPTMLIDHDPDPFLSLLALDQQSTVSEAFDSSDFARFATQIATDATLVPPEARVAGDVSYGITTVERDLTVLEVVTRFVWVYSIETTDRESSEGLVVVRDEVEWWVRRGEGWLESSRGLWMPRATSHAWGSDCEAHDGGLLRPARDSADELIDDEAAIYDPEEPLDVADSC